MLLQRLAVAAVGLPLLAVLLLLSERWFGVAVTVLLAVAAIEFAYAAVPGVSRAGLLGAGAVTALIVAAARTDAGPSTWTLLPALALALVGVLRPVSTERPLRWPGALWWVTGVLYVGTLGAYFLQIRIEPDGRLWLVVLLAATFATDTGAYAVGRLVGRHRLAPRISPNKTWEGAAGGLLFGAAATVLAPLLLDTYPRTATVAVLAVALPLAAMAGDLLESALKRRSGIKDFSHLLPGHGGLLDRLDSLLLTAPTLYWILQWLGT